MNKSVYVVASLACLLVSRLAFAQQNAADQSTQATQSSQSSQVVQATETAASAGSSEDDDAPEAETVEPDSAASEGDQNATATATQVARVDEAAELTNVTNATTSETDLGTDTTEPSNEVSTATEPTPSESEAKFADFVPSDNVESWRPWFSGNIHLSVLSDRLSTSTINLRFGLAAEAGARRGPWGVFGHLEINFRAQTEFNFEVEPGTLNIAAGAERFLFRDRLRLAAAIGASILLKDQPLHNAPHLGIFMEVKPMGIRFARRSDVIIQLDLASVAIVAPVLGSAAQVDIQYRSTLTIEWQQVD